MKKDWLVKSLALGVVVLFIGTGAVSALNVNLIDGYNTTLDNHPPNVPDIKGPKLITPGTYEWTFRAIDPDGDNVSYQINWGDTTYEDWSDWYASGEEITCSHYYYCCGHFPLAARAKDIYNVIGEWKFLGVTVSRSNQIINLPFLQFLEHFQNAFPVLKYVLEGR